MGSGTGQKSWCYDNKKLLVVRWGCGLAGISMSGPQLLLQGLLMTGTALRPKH